VLTGQCIELGAEGLPLAPLVDALRTLARTTPPEALAEVLGPARAGLARLLPELAMPLLAVAHWPALAIVLVAITGTGAILVEILTETGLQRTLPPHLFGRAYGLALPASLGGIVVGSLVAPLLISALGGTGALIACGAVVVAYALLLPRTPGRQPAPPAEVATAEETLLAAAQA
jgi:hypothetical protein